MERKKKTTIVTGSGKNMKLKLPKSQNIPQGFITTGGLTKARPSAMPVYGDTQRQGHKQPSQRTGQG